MIESVYGVDTQGEIDCRVNKYTLKCLKITLVALWAIWIANVLNIFIIDTELLSQGVLGASIVIAAAIVFGKVSDLHKPWVKYVLLFNMILAITILGITLTYHTVLLSVLPLLVATQYTSNRMIVYTYLLSIVSIFSSVVGGYFWGLCDANMQIITTQRASYYLDAATSTMQFQASNTNPWYTLIMYYVIPRCILLLLLLPVIQSISSNLLGYAEYAGDMKRLSEIDEMTGLYNKNKFLQMVEKSYSKFERVCVVFWDVNNLKRINDTLGHDQGDFVITNVGNMILGLSAENRKAYRLGGDEFVMVMENPKDGELEEVLKKWEEIVKVWRSLAKIEISVALGYDFGAGKDIDNIIKNADKKMYLKKQEQKS